MFFSVPSARPELVEGYPRALEDILQQVQDERGVKLTVLSCNIHYFYSHCFLRPKRAIVIGTTTSAMVHGTTTAIISKTKTLPIDTYQLVKP